MRRLRGVQFPVLLFATCAVFGPLIEARELDFETRVAAQEAIERVHYLHRTGATLSFEEAVSRELLERKVRTYLAQSVALEQVWNRPLTSDALRLELERMAKRTRMPSRLHELFAALNDDPLLIQECLVRPVLVDRLARRFFESDVRIHAGARARAEELRLELTDGRLDPLSTHSARRVTTLIRQDDPDAYDRLRAHAPPGVGQIGEVVGGRSGTIVRVVLEEEADRAVIAEYGFPKRTREDWWADTAHLFDNAPGTVVADDGLELPPIAELQDENCDGDFWDNGVLDDLPDRRGGHSAVWTGAEMILWGGQTLDQETTWTGQRYQPATDSWASVSTVAAPPSRAGHRAVWTGQVMIVWGGGGFNGLVNTGGRYDPVTDSWTPTAVDGVPGHSPAPIGRASFTLTWTGDRMIVWGGSTQGAFINSGGLYDPVADTWDRVTVIGAPEARASHTAVWTGDRMIVWGGNGLGPGGLDSGGVYDPTTDSWTATSSTNPPEGRDRHTAVWTGDEMVVWGGEGDGGISLNTGGHYDPVSNNWSPTSMINAPEPREFHSAVWTGDEMIVWGGSDYLPGTFDDGKRYVPSSGTWLPMPPAPMPLAGHSVVWADDEMIVWDWGDGARYIPASNSWTETWGTHAPTRRSGHSAVWTGNEMIVWGGTYEIFCGDCWYNEDLDTGGVYSPVTDSWTPTPTDGVPEARRGHGAVWTGSEMILWGGDRENGGVTDTGARFDPVTFQWMPTSVVGGPTARKGFTAVWSGSEMMIWGGRQSGGVLTVTGGRYDPGVDSWQPFGAQWVGGRWNHTAVWTGDELIVWGGRTLGNFPWDPTATGARYDPDTNIWTAIATQGAPEARYWHTAVWTGDEMIVWGGENADHDAVDTGARYDPVEDAWVPTSTVGTPGIRHSHTTVWTGSQMIVWGGTNAPAVTVGGGRYNPGEDTWSPATEVGGLGVRVGHSAIWTGERMIVWDGKEDATGGSYDPDGVDQDGDHHGCVFDCDDASAGVWRAPGEAGGLRFAANKITLEWNATAVETGPDTVYDVVRGRGSGLPVGTAVEVCLESDYPVGGGTGTIALDDETVPQTGRFFWYLVRPTNVCGVGSYGSTSAGAPRSSAICD